MSTMITIDGSKGEGGGQVLRTALGLSLVTGRPFKIENIRGKRKKPGLFRQHLTAVNAACGVGQAKVIGAELKSSELTFVPSEIKAGHYHFAIGTAGSCSLVFQAILPALLQADGASQITLEGGTHNPFAPSFDYLKETFLPLLGEMGVGVKATLESPGFYPAGGGKMILDIDPPSTLSPLHLTKISNLNFKAKAICAELPVHIGQRELTTIQDKLEITESATELVSYDQYGPGNVVSIFATSDLLTETFVGFGQKRQRAEHVASRIVGQARLYQNIGVAVGPHLADQLLIPLALAGSGEYLTCEPTQHTLTNLEVIKMFLETDIAISRVSEQIWQVTI